MLMYEITAPHFSAKFLLLDGIAVKGQRPLDFMAGWSLWQVVESCDRHGWIFEQIRVGGNHHG